MRKPLQGVGNIVRFNWHFYVIALVVIFALIFVANYLGGSLKMLTYLAVIAIILSTLISLVASLYIYDLSGFYHLKWIEDEGNPEQLVNINAGFDETSILLKNKFANAQLNALDFYDPKKHTEVSIKRARKAYPPFPDTKTIETTTLPLADDSVDFGICDSGSP